MVELLVDLSRLKELAFEYAFLLDLAGVVQVVPAAD